MPSSPYSHYERLSALDAMFLEIEDANVHMHVGAIGIFDAKPLSRPDGGLDIERIRRLASPSLARSGRFRQRLDHVPILGHPVWVDDERFNLDYHLRHTALPEPGDERQLKRLMGRVMSQKLDLHKPLWEMWFVEGLEGERFAVITKAHHCMIDGISGVDLLGLLMGPDTGTEGAEAQAEASGSHRWLPRRAPNAVKLLADETWRRAGLPLGALRAGRKALGDPGRSIGALREAIESVAEALGAGLSGGSRTPLNPDIGPHRRFDWMRMDLDAAKDVKNRLGGTVNDVVLATASGALRSFLASRGVEVDALDFRAQVPVNLRGDDERGTLGNRITMLFAKLPVAEPDPRRRFERVVETTTRLKASQQGRGTELLEKLADWTAKEVLAGLALLTARQLAYNVVVTNVPGPQFPVYLLGARMLEIYPLVPLVSNQGLGIALFSYQGSLFWGFNADWDAVPDLHDLVLAVQGEFETLRKLEPAGADVTDFHYERLTQLDHSFLIYEGPSSPMHVGATQIFEAAPLRRATGGIDLERIEEYVLSRMHRLPRYRQRLAATPIEKHPIWIDDPRFNLRYHLRHTRLPRPGDERLLKRTVGRIVSQHLDRGKPLWEMWLIEGVEGDRVAVVSKIHHCMIDGVSGVDLLSVLLTPEPTEKTDPPHPWLPRPAPSTAQLAADEAARALRLPLSAASALWGLAVDEDHARERLAERLGALRRQGASNLGGATPTPLNQPVGPYRRVDWSTMDLGRMRRLAKQLGGTVNDVVLAVTAGGVRRFLRRSRQEDVDGIDFRVMAPVSTRDPSERGKLGNRVSAWILQLPVGERDPLRRFERVREATRELKESKAALAADTLAQVTEWTGSTLLSLGTRLVNVSVPFNMVVTNVPGPREALHLLGARMLEAHPIVPLMGNLATGIALMSYRDALSWGFTADWDLVPDLHELVLAVEHSFETLCEAAGVES